MGGLKKIVKKASKTLTNVVSPVTMGFGSLPKNIQGNIKDLGQANVDIYKGLFTGNFGQAKDSFIKAGVAGGEMTGLIQRQKEAAAPGVAPTGPTRDQIATQELGAQNDLLKKRRASQTLFAGGSLESPSGFSSASSLLGGF